MSTNTVPAASPEILGRIAQHLADGTLEVPASVASSGAVGGDLDCTDSWMSSERVRPVPGVPRKFARPER
jgi:hypothetical protein